MIRIAILFLATVLILCAAGAARGATVDEEGRLIFSDEEKAACRAEVGCRIVTAAYLTSLVGQCGKEAAAPIPPAKPRLRMPRKDEA